MLMARFVIWVLASAIIFALGRALGIDPTVGEIALVIAAYTGAWLAEALVFGGKR